MSQVDGAEPDSQPDDPKLAAADVPPHLPKKQRHRTAIAVVLLLLAGAGLTFWRLDVEPAGAGAQSTVWLERDRVTVDVDGQTISVADVLYASDTSLGTARQRCEDDALEGVDHTDTRLQDNVLVVAVDDTRVCIPQNATRNVDGLNIRAEELRDFIDEREGVRISWSDGEDIAFHRITYWKTPTWTSRAADLLAAGLIGLALGIWGSSAAHRLTHKE